MVLLCRSVSDMCGVVGTALSSWVASRGVRDVRVVWSRVKLVEEAGADSLLTRPIAAKPSDADLGKLSHVSWLGEPLGVAVSSWSRTRSLMPGSRSVLGLERRSLHSRCTMCALGLGWSRYCVPCQPGPVMAAPLPCRTLGHLAGDDGAAERRKLVFVPNVDLCSPGLSAARGAELAELYVAATRACVRACWQPPYAVVRGSAAAHQGSVAAVCGGTRVRSYMETRNEASHALASAVEAYLAEKCRQGSVGTLHYVVREGGRCGPSAGLGGASGAVETFDTLGTQSLSVAAGAQVLWLRLVSGMGGDEAAVDVEPAVRDERYRRAKLDGARLTWCGVVELPLVPGGVGDGEAVGVEGAVGTGVCVLWNLARVAAAVAQLDAAAFRPPVALDDRMPRRWRGMGGCSLAWP